MRRVDEVLGVLEQVVLGEEFGELQLDFCKKNCHHFEDSEENKLVYMDLFRCAGRPRRACAPPRPRGRRLTPRRAPAAPARSAYTSMLEEIIERELKSRIEDFEMESFLALLISETSEEELQGNEIFELLLTITDFEHFKDFMLGCRAASLNSDLGVDFALKPTPVTIHDLAAEAPGAVHLPL